MITIAWDVDDVLNDLMRCWLFDKWLAEHSDCGLTFEQITENPPQRIIGCSLEEYRQSLDDFRLSKACSLMQPNQEILAWFNEHGHKARHIALTSVPIKAAHISADWVIRNFGSWIRSFNFVPSLRNNEQAPDYGNSKADYLRWLNKVDVLVEYSDGNIHEAKESGIKGILLKKPWNKGSLSVKAVLTEINRLL